MTDERPSVPNDECCYALVRLTDRVSALEGWRVDHETSPAGMHSVTRGYIKELREDMVATRAGIERIASRQTQILAAIVASGVLLVLNLALTELLKR